MTFLLSKLLWPLLQPAMLITVLLLAGAVLGWTRWWRAGRVAISGAAMLALLLAVLPTGPWLLRQLEERFPPPRRLERVDGIIILGGAIDTRISAAHGQPALTAAAERMTAAATLAREHPAALLVFTGGSGILLRPDLKEAPVARELLSALGVEPHRLILEDLSRDTFENAAYTRMLVQPQPGERWLLVTSAFHMPRAVGVFTAMDWQVIPYPVDYRSHDGSGSLGLTGDTMNAAGTALHEWVGLFAYYLGGRTRELFPAPPLRGDDAAAALASASAGMAQTPSPNPEKDRIP